MLKYLQIRNFALVDNSEIEFSEGLNIISGETGAGKSIIIQALSILLGGRASVDQIRTGFDEAALSGTISINNKKALEYLKELGIGIENDEIIVRRILSNNGKSRSFINGTQVTSKELLDISAELFDFHGQHEGVSLLRRNTHINYLDDFIDISGELTVLKDFYRRLKAKYKELNLLLSDDDQKKKRIELIKFEIQEIESAKIKDNEDEELRNEIKIYENVEKISSLFEDMKNNFSGNEGVLSKLRICKNSLAGIAELDKRLKIKDGELSDIFYKLEDIYSELNNFSRQYETEPNKLDTLIERSETIEKMKRKFGGSIGAVRKYLIEIKKELNMIIFSSEQKEKIEKEYDEIKKMYISQALKVSKIRKEKAVVLEKSIINELNKLGMEKSDFKISAINEDSEDDYIEINLKKLKYGENGIDFVEFLISPNVGEPLKSLIKIASGGELSRIILALKTILSSKDSIETMIFDEIDAGIGGKVAISVAKSLKSISRNRQVICITHLAQIAALGDRNFLIKKESLNERTKTGIQALNDNLKKNEIARMLSGNVTEISLNHADELISSLNSKDL